MTRRPVRRAPRAAVLLAASISTVAWAGNTPDGISWEKDPDAATRESKTSARPILVDVGAVWCAPCKEMDKTTFRDPTVVEAAGEFVALRVDADARPTFAEHYDCEVFPTILFLDARGEVIGRRTGYRSAADMRQDMDHVSHGYAAYLTAVRADTTPDVVGAVASYLLGAGNPERAASILKKALKDAGALTAELRAPVELQLAEAQLALGDSKPAAVAFERLYNESSDDALKSRALTGLVLALRQRGNDKGASQALDLLRQRYPRKAAEIEGTGAGG